MREMQQDRIALDRASVRTFDDLSGHMHVAEANISKACVNPYRGNEIPGAERLGLDPDKIYNLLRDPEELKAAAASFDGKPIVLAHREQKITTDDAANRVGSISAPFYEHPYLKAKLALWTKDAIDVVESGTQRQLSGGYGYEADMTPGTFDGERYDGVMRNLRGNHVALVREGRAGPDVMVGDSKEGMASGHDDKDPDMNKAQKILADYFAPRLAADAKLDLRPALKGVTKATFKGKRDAIAADVKKIATPKLAKDANLDDVVDLLDKLETVIPEAEVDLQKIEPVEAAPAADEDPMVEVRKKLKAKGMSDEEIDEICGAAAPAEDDAPDDMDPPAAMDEPDPKPEPPKKDDAPKGAMDMKNMVSKTAMDQALAAVRRTAVAEGAALGLKTAREIATAEKEVAPYVGEINIACDSAEAVYRHALKALKIEGADKLHADALRPVLLAQPKPGEHRPARTPIAQDSAADTEYATRFPNAGRLKK